MLLYFVKLFQERPVLTMFILSFIIMAVFFTVRELIINIIEEAALAVEHISDSLIVINESDELTDDDSDYDDPIVHIVLKTNRSFYTYVPLIEIKHKLETMCFAFIPDKDSDKKVFVTRYNLLFIEELCCQDDL